MSLLELTGICIIAVCIYAIYSLMDLIIYFYKADRDDEE